MQSLQFSLEDRERENELRKYYQSKIDHLEKEVKELDDKVIRLATAYKNTVEELKQCTAQRDSLSAELQQSIDVIRNLKVLLPILFLLN